MTELDPFFMLAARRRMRDQRALNVFLYMRRKILIADRSLMARHKPVLPMRSAKHGGVKSRHRTRLARKSRQAVFGLRAKTACTYCSTHGLPQNIALLAPIAKGTIDRGFSRKYRNVPSATSAKNPENRSSSIMTPPSASEDSAVARSCIVVSHV